MNSESNRIENNIQVKRILVPIDGSEYSHKAAKFAARIAKYENAKLFCIHFIVRISYGYNNPAYTTDQYYKDIKDKIKSWFDEVRLIAKVEGVKELKTESFMDLHSVIDSILDYAVSHRN